MTLAALLGIDEEGGIKVISPSFESEANEHERGFLLLKLLVSGLKESSKKLRGDS